MVQKKTSKVEKFVDKWHCLLDTDKKYAIAYFVSAWSRMDDDDACAVLLTLEKEDFETILNYPIWS